MESIESFYVPQHLDDPERFLFWTLDEAVILLIPLLLGFILKLFLTGMGVGIAGFLFWRKLKGAGKVELIQYALYWHFPSSCFRLRATPPSYQRWYLG